VNGNGNGNFRIGSQQALVIIQGVSVLLLGVLGWLFQGVYDLSQQLNDRSISQEARIEAFRRDIDRNSAKLDELWKKVYERP
jgi:hypothetical protein